MKTFFLIIIAILLVAFSLSNAGQFEVFVPLTAYSIEMPVFLFATFFIAVGVFWGGVIYWGKLLIMKKKLWHMEQRQMALKNELESLKISRETTQNLISKI